MSSIEAVRARTGLSIPQTIDVNHSTASLDCMSACCQGLVQISLGCSVFSRRRAPESSRQASLCTMRILLIEDHIRLAQTIVRGLDEFGFRVDAFATAEGGINATRSAEYEALILDLGLPDRDGLEVISELRQRNIELPILILTARDGVDDRVAGLDRGADDYLMKPFAMKELAARLRALLRRPGRVLGATLESGNLRFNTVLRQVVINGCVVAISRREIGALELLMRRAGQVVSKR